MTAGARNFEDWLAICEVKARYCRLLDTKDWEGWGQLFTEDVMLDTTGSGGGVTHGRAALLASVRGAIGEAKTAHQVHSPEIAIDGDRATGIWAMQDRVIWGEGRALTGYGHYREEYVRQDGTWRIARQWLTRLIVEMA